MKPPFRWRRIVIRMRRSPLAIFFSIATALVVLVSCYGLYDLLRFARDQEAQLQSQRLRSDLRAFIGALAGDNGALIRANLRQTQSAERTVTPLTSDKRYFLAEPGQDQAAQRPMPPRACFVDLKATTPDDSTLSACVYVMRESGWVYLHLVYDDAQIQPFLPAEPGVAHDSLDVSFIDSDSRRTWRMRFQETPEPGQFRLLAEALHNPQDTQIGEYFQGWAFRAQGARVVAMFRLRFSGLGEQHVIDRQNGVWPARISNVRIEFSREEVAPGASHHVAYPAQGRAQRTLRDLYGDNIKTGARLSLQSTTALSSAAGAPLATAWVHPPDDAAPGPAPAWRVIRRYWSSAPRAVYADAIPYTDLIATLTQTDFPINRSILRAITWMSLLLALLLVIATMLGLYVVRPARRMARKARALAMRPLSSDSGLPYANQRTELGTLARAFNRVLRNARTESERRLHERQERAEEQRRRENEAMRAREQNLRTVGHEIRSPLQALLSFHPIGDPARRYVERMIRAVQSLYGSANAQAAFADATLALEHGDIVPLLREIAQNAPRAGIQDVSFEGPAHPVPALFDEGALEDSITHILNNANRHRLPGSVIRLRVAQRTTDAHSAGGRACITISNQGPTIDPTMLEKIFEYGVSIGPDRDPSNEGQGLFAAQNYALKMGGSIRALNLADGVAFEIELPGADRA